jgi:hypothetical protein
MSKPFNAGRTRALGTLSAIAVLATGLTAILLSSPRLSAAESPPARLIRCGRDEAKTTLNFMYRTPGSMPMGDQIYAKPYAPGDERRPITGASSAVDALGTQTITVADFGEREVTFTITQVPGPDRLNTYRIVIHVPFRQNVAGTVNGTKYDATWRDVPAGEARSPNFGPANNLLVPPPVVLAGPVMSSVTLSPKELMMLPHDPRLIFVVQHDSETGSGDWIRFQARGPAGEISQVFRIQTLSDPGGILGTTDVAESEVKAVCAPYLPNSRERQCNVQVLKRASGNVYYCLLTNSAFASNTKPIAGQFRYLFAGLFRVGGSVAFVVGNLNQPDDADFRMMMETLRRAATLPIITSKPATTGKNDNLH